MKNLKKRAKFIQSLPVEDWKTYLQFEKIIKNYIYMKKLLLLFAISALLISCNTAKRCEKCPTKYSYIEKTKDSVSYIVKDSLIILPQDSSLIEMLIKCDSIGNAHLVALNQINGKRIITKVVIKDNKVKITALEKEIQQKNTIISKYQKSSNNTVKIVQVEKCSSWWHTFFKYGFFILLALLIIVIFLWWWSYKFFW